MRKTIVRFPAVKARVNLSRSRIYDGVKRGTFPRPISLGARAVGWIESEIDEWLESRIESSRTLPEEQLRNGGAQ